MAKRTKKLKQENFEAMRKHLCDRIQKTGEEIKNDFPNILRTAIDNKAWQHFTDSTGQPYKNLVDWLHGGWPQGCMMGLGRDAITYEEALKLCAGHPDVHRVLATNAPKRRPGRKSKNQEIAVSTPQLNRRNSKSTGTMAARLAQEKPDFYEAYLRGEYKTITAAARAAGLIKDDANLRRAKSAIKHMSKKQLAEFKKWLDSKEGVALLGKR